MGATQFVPLEGRLIDEGVFLDDLNKELRKVQQVIADFCEEHGERAKGATCKLQCAIEIKIVNPDDKSFAVKSSMKSTAPPRPDSVNIAVGGIAEDGKMALFVRQSGADENHPRQLKLSTQDGKIVDTETGEVLDE